MLYNPIPAFPATPAPPLISFCLNFLIDGVVYACALGIYHLSKRRTANAPGGHGEKTSPVPKKRIIIEFLLGILLHVFVGYGADVYGVSLRYYVRLDNNWVILALILGLFQGIALRFTLYEKRSPKSLNLWLGIILFGTLTNPYRFPFLLPTL